MVQITNTAKMSPENFVYWLQGLLELQPDLKTLNEEQVKLIRIHLKYVFDGKHLEQVQPYTPVQVPHPSVPQFVPMNPFQPMNPDDIVVVC